MKRPSKISCLAIVFLGLVCHLSAGEDDFLSRDRIHEITRRAADWQLLNPHSRRIGDWVYGPYMNGLVAIGRFPGNNAYIEKAANIGRQQGWQPIRTYWQANDHCTLQAWLEIYEMQKDPAMLKPSKEYMDAFLASGDIQNQSMEFIKGNNFKWSWCDALFMSPPTVARLGRITGEKKYFDYLHKWWWLASDFYYDQEEHLYFRDQTFFNKKEPNGRKVFWSRGNGWVIGGLVRVLQYLDKDDPVRGRYQQQLREMCEKLAEIQSSDGLWRSGMLDPDSYVAAETSGSSFFVYGLAYAVNEKIIDSKKFTPIVKKAWQELCSYVRQDGRLTGVQPIDDSPGRYDTQFTMPYGVGAFLLAGSEMYRLVNSQGADKLITFNDNGGWCWYQDERVIVHGGKLTIGSVADAMGTGGKLRNGNIEVVSYDIASPEAVKRVSLHDKFEPDDHDVPGLLALPDGKVLAVYSRHSTDNRMRCRITANSDDISVWNDEYVLEQNHPVCYSNVFQLSAEKNRIYNFYRGENWDPSCLISNDNGRSWSYSGRLMTKDRARPYVKYASNNIDAIHFLATEAHPQEYDGTSIFHGCFKGGAVYKSDGTFIKKLSDGPVNMESLTKIYAGDGNHKAWTIDLHLDKNGYPYAVYSVQHNKDVSDNRYRYARWDGKQWHDHNLAFAGTHLYDSQWFYTGLVALDPQNADRLYISTDADPETGKPLISSTDGKRHYELFAGQTEDGGANWVWQCVTKDSVVDNLRPVVPIWNNRQSVLLWMRGVYKTYLDFDTDIVGIFTLNR